MPYQRCDHTETSTDQEAEQVSKEVRAGARAEESEQRETRRDNDPALACDRELAAGHDLRGREDSDGTEQRR